VRVGRALEELVQVEKRAIESGNRHSDEIKVAIQESGEIASSFWDSEERRVDH